MSRQNKVNPGTYTQRGRLTQDDAARELRKQNALGSPYTWQPVERKAVPPKPSKTGRPHTATAVAGQATAAKPAAKAMTKTAPKAVGARKVGGAGPRSRSTAKRRTS